MTLTRIKIDLTQGIVEAEGSEEFVKGVYADFKEKNVASFAAGQPKQKEKKAVPPKPAVAANANKGPVNGKKTTTSSGTLIKDLDLSGTGKEKSLREYASQFVLKTNLERNLVFVSYLENELKLTNIGIDHVFTCYRNIPKTKIPGNLKQSLYDTSAKGWLDIESIENGISVPVAGTNHLEHDLPKVSVGNE